MNIREAILKAADHIGRHPDDFIFWRTGTPDGCGTPGCALGWIGHFLDAPHSASFYWAARDAMKLEPTCLQGGSISTSEFAFYNRMDELDPSKRWYGSARICASALRLYADKYHPADSTPSLDPAFIAFREKFAEAFE